MDKICSQCKYLNEKSHRVYCYGCINDIEDKYKYFEPEED